MSIALIGVLGQSVLYACIRFYLQHRRIQELALKIFLFRVKTMLVLLPLWFSIILSGTAWAVQKVFDFSGLRSGKKMALRRLLRLILCYFCWSLVDVQVSRIVRIICHDIWFTHWSCSPCLYLISTTHIATILYISCKCSAWRGIAVHIIGACS